MKILLCFCACLTAAYAHGVITYPVSPFSYSTYISPLTTIARPVGVTYTSLHGYPLTLGPSYFPLGVAPTNVIYTGFPGVVHYLPPVAPSGGKGKPGDKKKKPGEKNGDKDMKEETTEEPKKEEEPAEPKSDEGEDLSEK